MGLRQGLGIKQADIVKKILRGKRTNGHILKFLFVILFAFFRSEWDNLHFTQHVKNASEEVKKFQLPGIHIFNQ